ncbi:MAG: hypothetical protein IKU20_01770 [Lachnospiraceae bacterium]|nr:hypothetical protein [Lachnospiraceae bacterium]
MGYKTSNKGFTYKDNVERIVKFVQNEIPSDYNKRLKKLQEMMDKIDREKLK